MSTYVITTGMLLAMNNTARRHNLNRQLTTKATKALDPEGLHIIGFTMLHNDEQIRCHILMKFSGDPEPHEGWVDVPLTTPPNSRDIDWARVTDHAARVAEALATAQAQEA